MGKPLATALLALLTAALDADAGSLVKGTWSTANCGSLPAAPDLDLSGVEAYNNSLKKTNAWHEKAEAYSHCVIKEANADSQAITQSANAQLEQFRAAVAKLNTAAATARSKFGIR